MTRSLTPLRLGVVFGGRSVEHEVSVHSAQHVLAAADPDRFEVVPLGVTREGVWLSPEETRANLERPEPPFKKTLAGAASRPGEGRPDDGLKEALPTLSRLDAVFPLIHGLHGEDGCLQGLLELLGVPYVGCGVAASALGMDKGLMKAVYRDAGLAVAEHAVLTPPREDGALLATARELEERLGLPAFVKPANGGSSLGVSKAASREDLAVALVEAARYDRRILVEEAIVGREVECGILGNEVLEASPVGEIVYQREFYDYEAKYLDPNTRIVAPADLPQDVVARVQQAALLAFRAIDAAGLSRVDFFLKTDGSLIIDEINTLPGFSPESMFPRLWREAGVSYSRLITRLVDLAIARHREKPLA